MGRRPVFALFALRLAVAVVPGPAAALADTGQQQQRQPPQSETSKRLAVDEVSRAAGGLAARHSLRAPVTDETFYFVMADRLRTAHRQRHRRA